LDRPARYDERGQKERQNPLLEPLAEKSFFHFKKGRLEHETKFVLGKRVISCQRVMERRVCSTPKTR
jgi:hypothetical protein